ncbi:purpurin-like [Notolabrus celidotus]|uniref:purpurin-like n=1 Tax=Notolabrus celidotus TaxID=1203425 RepID=UPI001490636C|nr:purpurin-like [Notolabrus celidotus]
MNMSVPGTDGNIHLEKNELPNVCPGDAVPGLCGAGPGILRGGQLHSQTGLRPKRYEGKWYALQKKDPEGLFLQDNISAEYTIGDDGSMIASSRGRVTLFGFWVVCADMAAQYSVPDPGTPGKMFMNYQGLASYLSSGGDNYWVIDTDYENYAITYACRKVKDDGSCEDGYALVFSRNPRGLPPAIQRSVRQKQEEICMAGEFQPVLQSGAC